jgi:HlyD family secretion protein
VRGVVGLALCIVTCRGGPDPAFVVGTLERERVDLVAEAFEPIVEIAVREGDHVGAGQTVVRLDDTRGRAEVAQAEAALAQARARLAELVRGPRSELVAEARARLDAAETTRANEARDLRRTVALAEDRLASRQQVDTARTQFDAARARQDEAQAALERLRTGTTAEEIDQANAAVAQAGAALAAARLRLDRLVVRAPREGRIDALPFHLGERPPAGTLLGVLLADGAPYARVFVPETVRARIAPGAAARVRVDGVGQPFVGRVRSIATEAAFTPHYALTERDRGRLSYEAKVDLTGPDTDRLPAGLPVEVTLEPDHAG